MSSTHRSHASQEQKREIENALVQLQELSRVKITLSRPVFFVPGPKDDNAASWTTSGGSTHFSMQQWLGHVVVNPEQAYFINFVNERRLYGDALDLAGCLKKKVNALKGKSNEFDLVIDGGMGNVQIIHTKDLNETKVADINGAAQDPRIILAIIKILIKV